MGTFRRLPPEVLEILGLEPEGEDDEPDERRARLALGCGWGVASPP